jgi:CBS domain-containing protein
VPIQNLARYYAFASGITAAPTLERLVAIRDVAGEDVTSERILRDAFVSMQHLQLRHQANRLRHGRQIDNVIETWTLPPLTRASLQEALREVVAAQKRFKPV